VKEEEWNNKKRKGSVSIPVSPNEYHFVVARRLRKETFSGNNNGVV
jgi:hypothetical protein